MKPPYAAMVDRIDHQVMERDKSITIEECGYDEQGTPVIYLTKKMPLHNIQGEVSGVLGLSMDITQRKQAEEKLHVARLQAQDKSRKKSDFIRSLSHDLRTPFSGILGFAQYLQDNEVDPSKHEKLGYIIKS